MSPCLWLSLSPSLCLTSLLLTTQQIEFEEVLASRVKAVNAEHKQKLRAVDEQTKEREAAVTQLRNEIAALTAKYVCVCCVLVWL